MRIFERAALLVIYRVELDPPPPSVGGIGRGDDEGSTAANYCAAPAQVCARFPRVLGQPAPARMQDKPERDMVTGLGPPAPSTLDATQPW